LGLHKEKTHSFRIAGRTFPTRDLLPETLPYATTGRARGEFVNAAPLIELRGKATITSFSEINLINFGASGN
jgi:hypothetical protein